MLIRKNTIIYDALYNEGWATIDPPKIDPPTIDPPTIDPPTIDPPTIDPPDN